MAIGIGSVHPFDTMHGKYSAVTEAVVYVILFLSNEGKATIIYPVIAYTAVELEADTTRIFDVDCSMADANIGVFFFIPCVEITECKH